MKTVRGLGAALVVLLVLAVAGGQEPRPQATSLPLGSATIAEAKGQVSILSPQGAALTAQRGQVLPPETTIETGKGSLLLDLQDGSQVLVKAHSRAVLKVPEQAKGYSLELFLGKILAKVRKRLGDNPSFRMGTPTAVITVRGTRFEVEVNKKNKTTVYVYEGLVEVAGLGAENRPVLIRPGFFTDVEPNRLPRQPREMDTLRERGEYEHGPGGERPDSSRPGQDREQEGNPAQPESSREPN